MLQTLRDHFPKWLTFLLVGIFIILFTWMGVHSGNGAYGSQSSKNPIIIHVNKKAIYYNALKTRYEQLVRQIEAQQGVEILPENRVPLQQQALLQLMVEEILTQRTVQYGYRLHDADIVPVLKKMPEFQEQGKFSAQKFHSVLNRVGHTEASFLSYLKESIRLYQNQSGILLTAFVLPEELENAITLKHQARDFNYVIIPASLETQALGEQLVHALQNNPNVLPEKIMDIPLNWHKIKQATHPLSNLSLSAASYTGRKKTPPEILEAAFQISSTNKPILNFSLPNGSYAIIQLIAVQNKKPPSTFSDEQKRSLKQKLEFELGKLEQGIYAQSALYGAQFS